MMLDDVGGAATIEQVNIKMVWETAPSSTPRASAPLRLQTPILPCPSPTGVIIRQGCVVPVRPLVLLIRSITF